MKQAKTVLDIAFDENQAVINTDFLKEWEPYEELNKKVKRALVRAFITGRFYFQPNHNPGTKKRFTLFTFDQIESVLGLAYTSSSDYAALWVCNSGYLWADETHHFIGFAINTSGEVVGIADNVNEESIYIIL